MKWNDHVDDGRSRAWSVFTLAKAEHVSFLLVWSPPPAGDSDPQPGSSPLLKLISESPASLWRSAVHLDALFITGRRTREGCCLDAFTYKWSEDSFLMRAHTCRRTHTWLSSAAARVSNYRPQWLGTVSLLIHRVDVLHACKSWSDFAWLIIPTCLHETRLVSLQQAGVFCSAASSLCLCFCVYSESVEKLSRFTCSAY